MVTLIFKSQIFIIKNGSHCLVETHVKNADSHINFILLKKNLQITFLTKIQDPIKLFHYSNLQPRP